MNVTFNPGSPMSPSGPIVPEIKHVSAEDNGNTIDSVLGRLSRRSTVSFVSLKLVIQIFWEASRAYLVASCPRST